MNTFIALLFSFVITTPLIESNDSAMVHFDKAMDLYQNKKYDEAILHFSKSISEDASNDMFYLRRALAYEKVDRLEEAIEDYNIAISINPKPVYYNNMGIDFAIQENFVKAIEAYNSAIALNPDYAQAWLNRSAANHYMNNMDEACSDAQKALDLGLRFAQNYLNEFCQ